MAEITIPYHLTIPAILCIVGLLIILIRQKNLFRHNKRKLFWICMIVFLIFYLLILCNAIYEDIYCQWDLNRYDLDKNGLFGGQEITKEQEAAMERLTNDVGRNFSFITGFIFSTILSTFVFIIGKIFQKSK